MQGPEKDQQRDWCSQVVPGLVGEMGKSDTERNAIEGKVAFISSPNAEWGSTVFQALCAALEEERPVRYLEF